MQSILWAAEYNQCNAVDGFSGSVEARMVLYSMQEEISTSSASCFFLSTLNLGRRTHTRRDDKLSQWIGCLDRMPWLWEKISVEAYAMLCSVAGPKRLMAPDFKVVVRFFRCPLKAKQNTPEFQNFRKTETERHRNFEVREEMFCF